MLLILAIFFAVLAFVSGLIGVIGLFFAIGVFSVVSRISRLLFPVLGAVFVVLLVLALF